MCVLCLGCGGARGQDVPRAHRALGARGGPRSNRQDQEEEARAACGQDTSHAAEGIDIFVLCLGCGGACWQDFLRACRVLGVWGGPRHH